MIAGPNGSGKTTLTRQLRLDGVEFGEYINPDEIAATLSGAYAERVARAQALADEARDTCLRNRLSFSFETVMSHPSKVTVLRRAKELDFRTALYFVATESPELNIERVAQRVALGGHGVPIDRIRDRYFRTLALLPEALAHTDHAVLFDNSYGRDAGQSAVLRPFFRRDGFDVTLEPPLPNWALATLKGWFPQLGPR
jgi:predicted ABC-type ATPase